MCKTGLLECISFVVTNCEHTAVFSARTELGRENFRKAKAVKEANQVHVAYNSLSPIKQI